MHWNDTLLGNANPLSRASRPGPPLACESLLFKSKEWFRIQASISRQLQLSTRFHDAEHHLFNFVEFACPSPPERGDPF